MTAFITFTLLGLVLGSVYAIAASGLVLTYNTSGIFNFAHGAQAMLGAFLYWQLTVPWGVPTLPAVLIVVGVVGPLMGAILYQVIMRGLRDTAEVTRIVVTVAVLLGFVALSQWIWNPDEPRVTEMFFGSGATIPVFGATLRVHELICLVTAVLLAIGLRALFTRTRAGVCMRGVVDDPDLLRLAGHNPERIALLSWVLGSTLAVIAGVLVTPVGGGALEATALTLLVVDAFAAAMFGRLRSIPRTFVGALVLGLSVTYLVAYAPSTLSWVGNLRVSLPMIVLFVVLLLLPQDRLRGTAVRTRERYTPPTVRKAATWGVVFVGLVFLLQLLMVPSAVTTLTVGLTFGVIALSLVLLTGYAGELNLAPLSLGAIATIVAYHVGTTGFGQASRMTWWGLAIGVLVAALVGGLIALPALRLRGLYLALATMAFGVFVSNMVLRDTVEHRLFGQTFSIFPTGILIVAPLKVGPLDLRDRTAFLLTVAVLFAVLCVGLAALRSSGYGRRLAAMKDSPAATAMLGQGLVRLKLSVFVLSSAIAGLGGVLMSAAVGSVDSETYSIFGSLGLVMLTVVAGIGYLSGALWGGLLAGVGVAVLISTFNNLSTSSLGMGNVYGVIASLIAVLPAVIGIGVGKNPSGIVHDYITSYRALQATPQVLVGGAATGAVLYLLALTGVIGNWPFALLSVLLLIFLPLVGPLLLPGRRAVAAERRDPPLELQGLEQPLTPELRRSLDAALRLPDRSATPAPAAVGEPEDRRVPV